MEEASHASSREGSIEPIGPRDDDRFGDEALHVPPLRVMVVTVAAGGVGGMQRHTHDLARGLVAAGHDVEVVCPVAHELAPDLYGAHWTLLHTSGRGDPDWPVKLATAYEDAQTRAPLDIVHSESTSAAPLVRQGIDTPVAIMYHGNYLGLAKAHLRRAIASPSTASPEARQFSRMTWRYLRERNAWAFRGCETMVVSHQQARDTARSALIRQDRIHVVPNGVDLSLFQPRQRSSAREKLEIGPGVVLTAVGRLNREKGFDVALQALARIAPDFPEVRLVIVGDGEERRALADLAHRLGIAGRTDFVGAQPQDKVAEYLAASDVFVFPTRREEAGPLVVPQAMACGLPVVASNIGGVPEVLAPTLGSTVGVLVRPGSVSELEAALRLLLPDAALRSSLGRAGRERAVSEYSLKSMISRTVAVYRIAIARASGKGEKAG